MGTFKKAATTGELPDGGKQKVVLDGQEIVLARVGGSYYALANRCPHMGGDLSAGRLEGTVITCPRHGSQFDVRDGHNIRWTDRSGIVLFGFKLLKSPRPARTYKVKVEGGDIMVEV
jgi:3-phenylpropionate/trans-cinnamate dioxygenase ferredoxin component